MATEAFCQWKQFFSQILKIWEKNCIHWQKANFYNFHLLIDNVLLDGHVAGPANEIGPVDHLGVVDPAWAEVNVDVVYVAEAQPIEAEHVQSVHYLVRLPLVLSLCYCSLAFSFTEKYWC